MLLFILFTECAFVCVRACVCVCVVCVCVCVCVCVRVCVCMCVCVFVYFLVTYLYTLGMVYEASTPCALHAAVHLSKEHSMFGTGSACRVCVHVCIVCACMFLRVCVEFIFTCMCVCASCVGWKTTRQQGSGLNTNKRKSAKLREPEALSVEL
jgi:hypothetical protein